MKICTYELGGAYRLGALTGEMIADLTAVDGSIFRSMRSLYDEARRTGKDLASIAGQAAASAPAIHYDESLLRLPFAPSEIWGAGVTYLRSREARESETRTKGLYDHVYSATRPELFLKDSGGLRCRGPGQEVCVRADSRWSVPEPELAVVVDENAAVVGYTAGNDVSSRDIEGENALYLPQAKVYTGSSAIGPVMVTPDEVPDPHDLEISMRVFRDHRVIFEGGVNTSKMKRSIPELLSYLRLNNTLATFTVLLTGTSIVPPDEFSLAGGDVVEVEIEKIGLLRNPVKKLV